MHQLFLSLGSNMQDRLALLESATFLIEKRIGSIKALSGVYETAAWGLEDQADFLNLVLIVDTTFDVLTCLDLCQEIELELGRERIVHWGPRTIDIDILYFDEVILNTTRLVLPHPRLSERNFVLEPLAEIASIWVDPREQKTVTAMLKSCEDPLPAKRIMEPFLLKIENN